MCINIPLLCQARLFFSELQAHIPTSNTASWNKLAGMTTLWPEVARKRVAKCRDQVFRQRVMDKFTHRFQTKPLHDRFDDVTPLDPPCLTMNHHRLPETPPCRMDELLHHLLVAECEAHR